MIIRACVPDRAHACDTTQVDVSLSGSRRTGARRPCYDPFCTTEHTGDLLTLLTCRCGPLLEAFLVQRVATVSTPYERGLLDAVHALVANGAVILNAWDTPLLCVCVSRSDGRCFASSTGKGLADARVGNCIGSWRSVGKDIFKLGSNEGLLVPVSGFLGDLKNFKENE